MKLPWQFRQTRYNCQVERYLKPAIVEDWQKKMVLLVGPRQIGKTTLARQLLDGIDGAQYLNFDAALDRKSILEQSWHPAAPALVFDELHKMRRWKAWLKGIYDVRPAGQRILVTGSARLDFLRRAGDSLAGRFFALRMHPISVKEWCGHAGVDSEAALAHLIERGGFPEPCLARTKVLAERWRLQYIDGLIREEVLEYSRLHEVNTMRLLLDLLRERVGSPLSVASLARDLGASTTTINRYLSILEALFIVFTIRPWHRNVSRSLLKAPKVYFHDTGLVRGDEGVRFENAVATMLSKAAHYRHDVLGESAGLHYLRTRDGSEIDFVLSEDTRLTHLIECKLADANASAALVRFAADQPTASAVQLVRHLRNERQVPGVTIAKADRWLASLPA